MHGIVIRTIELWDNAAIASIIRAALTEFGANKPGTVFLMKQLTIYSNFFPQQNVAYILCPAK